MPTFGSGAGGRGSNLETNAMSPVVAPPVSLIVIPLDSVTGAQIAYTEGDDTAAFAGTATPPPVNGTLAYTEGNDTAAFSGTATPPPITGTLAYTESADTIAAAGSVGVNGTLAFTEGNDTAALSGTVGVNGTLAYTEGNDTAAFSGTGGSAQTDDGTQNRGALLWGPPRRTPTRPAPPTLPLLRVPRTPPPPTFTARIRFTEDDDTARIEGEFDDWWLIEADDELLVLT